MTAARASIAQSMWALMAALLFSLMAVFVKRGLTQFAPMELVFYRAALGGGGAVRARAFSRPHFSHRAFSLAFVARSDGLRRAVAVFFRARRAAAFDFARVNAHRAGVFRGAHDGDFARAAGGANRGGVAAFFPRARLSFCARRRKASICASARRGCCRGFSPVARILMFAIWGAPTKAACAPCFISLFCRRCSRWFWSRRATASAPSMAAGR